MVWNPHERRPMSEYRLTPKTVQSGVPTEITIRPLGKAKLFDDGEEYRVRLIPMECYRYSVYKQEYRFTTFVLHPENGILRFTHAFDEEQEWVVDFIKVSDASKGMRPHCLRLYSLFEDLYALNPYRGDLHCHSVCSDGKEDPAVLAANYRKGGYDFVALTDHFKWKPSDDMINAYRDIPLNMQLFHGEEVHHPDIESIHIVNFGGSYGISDYYAENAESVHPQMLEEAKDPTLPKDIDPLEYVYRRWYYRQIKKSGGIAIVAHPFWIAGFPHFPGYNMSRKMLDYVLETGIYDAVEMSSGQSVYENNIQEAYYYEKRAEGYQIPMVGASDAHETDTSFFFHWQKTVVFAKDLSFESVRDAILDQRSVAVEEMPGEELRVHGPFRYQKYTRFLLEHYFPAHDELCAEEALLMREYAIGHKEAGEALRALAGRSEKQMQKLLRNKDV